MSAVCVCSCSVKPDVLLYSVWNLTLPENHLPFDMLQCSAAVYCGDAVICSPVTRAACASQSQLQAYQP